MNSFRIQVPGLLNSSAFFFLVISMVAALPSPPLKVGFYQKTCPSAEIIVRKTVVNAISQEPSLGAGLIRMHFHDCFVRGCDASVLLDSLPGRPSEKESPANKGSLKGFQVIDKAKAKLESKCPITVSCSDIIAFAARDSAYYLGLITYAVPSGRRDGTVSLEVEPIQELPAPFFNVSQLKESFARKGLSVDEMVTLSGAHSVGSAHCTSFANRLSSFNATHDFDPSLNKAFAAQLKTKCARNGATALLDDVTPNRLDNIYYKNLIGGKGLLTSDQTLLSDPLTASMVRDNWYNPAQWTNKYARAMVLMGSIEVLTGKQGEIRKNCRITN